MAAGSQTGSLWRICDRQDVKVSHAPLEVEKFLRLNFYSKVRWRVPIDPTKHYFDSKFEIKTTVHKQAEWREKLAAAR